jgi:3-oxoacyl-[acyl-carrier-protein] synthase II
LDDPAEAPAGLDAWTREVAVASGTALPAIALSTACSSGSDAIAFGAGLIRAGVAQACVCGGADVLTPAKRLGHSTLGTLSPSHLRAFDQRHDGTLLGEGAAFMVLQSQPGVRTYALLAGAGSGNDAAGFTSPDPDARGALFALRRSLANARLEHRDIGMINAHGSGTPINDTTEAIAFRALFTGFNKPIAFATKGNFGHTLGATGAMEAVVTVLALAAGQVPPVAGLEQPDPAFPLTLPVAQPLPCNARFGASLTLGFGGFNTSLIFERYS